MKEQIRGGDLAGRLGGDEFALFLCGIGREAAERKGALLLKAAERLRGFSGDAEHPLGTSLGVALYDPRTGESLERSDEHTSGLQSLMRISYAAFCLNKKNTD